MLLLVFIIASVTPAIFCHDLNALELEGYKFIVCLKWDPRLNKLYSVIARENYGRGMLMAGKHIIDLGGDLRFIELTDEPNTIIAAVGKCIKQIVLNDEGNILDATVLHTLDLEPDVLFNYFSRVDGDGKLFFSTYSIQPGYAKLYRYDLRHDTSPKVMEEGLWDTKGMNFNPENTKLYMANYITKEIWVYDYNSTAGELSNKRSLLGFGLFDMTAPCELIRDTENNLWVALLHSYRVIKISSESGEILESIPVPSSFQSSLTWAGDNFNKIYVATYAGDEIKHEGILVLTPTQESKGIPSKYVALA